MKNRDESSFGDVSRKYENITKTLIRRKLLISTMESCTSGLIASLITDTEGSSAIMKGAFVTYCNDAKIMQGVEADIIDKYGVYSAETAIAMARACKAAYDTDVAIGVTGTLGNVDVYNSDSIVGEVFFAIIYEGRDNVWHERLEKRSSRLAYKLEVAELVADRLLEMLSEEDGYEEKKYL
ncbi:MAG: CinA family protein [Lachnospiraceae bacterium]|nr:CinA family protein [Lachnospiraceae bacterium]